MLIKKQGAFTFGSELELENSQMSRLIKCFNAPISQAESPLGGRASVLHIEIESLGPLVIKSYLRGGIIRHLNRSWYLKTGHPRSQGEYEMLKKVRTLGINAPEPLVFAFTKGLFYKTWLVMRKIPNVNTLAELSRNDSNHAMAVMESVRKQVSILIANRIHHVDLHPGNVIVDDKLAYLIDFDKSRIFKGSEKQLRQKYFERWQRAVLKYNLAQSLIEDFI